MSSAPFPIRSDILRKLAAHWDRLRGSRPMPRRAEFDPLDVRFALGYLSLIEVHRDPLRFYFRLDGTKQVELFGIDCTRRFLDEAMPRDHVVLADESYRRVVESKAPGHHLRKTRLHDRMIDYEVLILPFGRDDEMLVNYLVTGIVADFQSP